MFIVLVLKQHAFQSACRKTTFTHYRFLGYLETLPEIFGTHSSDSLVCFWHSQELELG